MINFGYLCNVIRNQLKIRAMKTTEINESLVGRRVKGVFTGIEVTGTITGIVENYSKSHPKQVANGSPEYQVCSKGVTIQLDKPVRWGDDFYTCYESTSRVSDEFGNLKYTELIDKECSPIIKHFRNLKESHPDKILLFRCGDFYESYENDAEVVSKVLGIVLTTMTGIDIKMAGFPHHALDMYLPKLMAAGKGVAICDQISDIDKKKQVRRTISDIVGK